MYEAISETGVLRRKKEFSWENILQACKTRRVYIELYKKKLLGDNNVQNQLEQLERKMNLMVIVMARAQAELDTKKILSSRKAEQAKSGWLSGWWSSSPTKTTQTQEIEDLKNEFTQGEEKDKLYKAIGYDENAYNNIFFPFNYVAYMIRFKIKSFKLSCMNENVDIAVAQIVNFNFDFKYCPSSSNMNIGIEVDSLNVTGINNVPLVKSVVDKGYLVFNFELNPFDKLCDFSINLDIKSLHTIYDIDTINQLYELFLPPEHISLEEIKMDVQNQIHDLRLVTYSQVQNALEKHKQLKLNIKVEPSYVIVPRNGNIADANQILLISLGEFEMNTKLVPKSNESKLDQMSNVQEMKQLIYERYTIHVKNVQIILSDRKRWMNDINQLESERHILFPFEITFNFNRSIIPSDVRFPQMEMEAQISSIVLKASSSQISLLLLLATTLPMIDRKPIENENLASSCKINLPLLSDELINAKNYAAKTANEISKISLNQRTASKSKSEEDSTTVIHKSIIFNFDLTSIDLTLYKTDRRDVSRFTQFLLDKLVINGEILTDKTLWLCLLVNDLRIIDLRPYRKENGINVMLSKL